MNLGGLEGLAERERRHDGWQPLGHHRLARTRATHQQDVVPTGTGDLEGALDVLLALHIGKIVWENALSLGELGAGIDHCGLQFNIAVEEFHHIDEVVHAIDVEVVDHRRLESVGTRQDEAVEVQLAGQNRHGQGALDGTQAAIEREFAHEHVAVQPFGVDFLVGGEDADGEWQVIGRALLLDVSGRHVHHDLLAGEVISRLLHGAAHALGALPDCGIGQADNHESHTPLHGHLDLHLDGVDAVYRCSNRSR